MNPIVLSGHTSFPVTFLASFLIWFMFAGLVVVWMLDGKINRQEVFQALLATFIAWSVTEVVKTLLPTARPFQLNGSLPMTITIPFDASFPSGHAATAFALATSVRLYDKKVGVLFFIGAVLVGWGRILSNVHFLGDIFAGIVIGMGISYFIDKFRLFRFSK